MTPLFHPIEGAQAVIYCKPGSYRQVSLYERGGHLYAKHGSGFVRVYAEGGTSHPNVRCDPNNIDMGDSGASLARDGHLWLVVGPTAKAA